MVSWKKCCAALRSNMARDPGLLKLQATSRWMVLLTGRVSLSMMPCDSAHKMKFEELAKDGFAEPAGGLQSKRRRVRT